MDTNQNASGPVVHLVANARSGAGAGGAVAEKLEAACRERSVRFAPHPVQNPEEIDRAAEEAVARAREDGGTVVVAGGDGTIRSVAEKAQESGVRFAVIPCGTFNYFARTHRVPEDQEAAIRLALEGESRPVRLGELNGKVFLINASLGIYAKSIHEREKNTGKWGRRRAVALYSTLRTFLADHRLLKVDMVSGPDRASLRTPMIFIGNNSLQLRNLKLQVAACMREDMLAMVMLKPLGKAEMLRVLGRGILRTLEKDEKLQSFCIDSLSIYSDPIHQDVALDGEIFRMASPFRVRSKPEALRMVLPPKAA